MVLPFSYTVPPLARDADGVSLPANSVELDGGTIQATDDSSDATLTHPAMAFPGHKVAAGGEVLWGWRRSASRSAWSTPDSPQRGMRSTSNEAWQWQRSATEAGAYSDIPAAEGGTSIPYTPSAGDLGKWLKATVTYDDATGTGWTGEATTAGAVASGAVQRRLHSLEFGCFANVGTIDPYRTSTRRGSRPDRTRAATG